MRTVRSAAQSRNRPRGRLAWIVVGVMVLLAIAAARAAAAPGYDDAGELSHDDDRAAGDRDRVDADDVARAYAWVSAPWRRREGPCNCDGDELARVIASGPSLAAVVMAAQRAAGIADDPTPSWRRRSRFAALVPWVTVRGGNSESWRDVTDPTISHAVALGGALAWRFDRVIYDPNEPRFTAFDISRRRERRRVAHQASRAYVVWVEAMAAVQQDSRWQLQLVEAQADLDALTDGWFSEQGVKPAQLR